MTSEAYLEPHNIPNNFKLISFDVTSLFANAPLDFTIDVILKRIYDENEVNTNIPKQQMRDLLFLCTKNVHFNYNGDIYTQVDGVAMGSPLGPVLAGIFMVELERTILPTLREHMRPWKRYVDDTIPYINEESIERVLSKLNGYHDNIEFTYEIENDGKLPFLDVLVIRKDYEVETTVYRKNTNNDIYLHWQSFSPTTWKRGTLQTLVSRAFRVCSNDKHLENEIKHLKKVFREINGYPNWVIEQTIENVKNQNEMTRSTQVITNTEENEHLLMLPYKGKVGQTTLKSLRNTLISVMPVNNTCTIIYTGTKLASKFNIKDEISKKHKHDLI